MMESREFNLLLLQRFPEMKEDFSNYVSWQDGIDTGSLLIVEDVLNKLFWRSVENGDYDLVKEIFGFAEKILEQGDTYACNVIAVGFLEAIKADRRHMNVLPCLPPRCKAVYDSIVL